MIRVVDTARGQREVAVRACVDRERNIYHSKKKKEKASNRPISRKRYDPTEAFLHH